MRSFQLLFMQVLSTLNFLLSTDFNVSSKFGYVFYSFTLNSRKFLIWFFTCVLTYFLCIRNFFQISWVCKLLFLLFLISIFNLWWSNRIQGYISIFLHLLRLTSINIYRWHWRKFHGMQSRRYILFVWVKCSLTIC